MKNQKIMKNSFIILLFFIISSISFFPLIQGTTPLNTPCPSSSQLHETNFLQTQQASSKIILEQIKGGIQLKITLNNTASVSYHNVEVIVEITNGILFTPRVKTYTIPILQPDGKTYTLQNQIMGFGINPTNYPHISILLNISGTPSVIGQADAFLFGPFIKIFNPILNNENAYQGYTLFTPEYGTNTYLIDNNGDIIHRWLGRNINGMAVYLLKNGNVIRSDITSPNPYFPLDLGGATGHVEIMNPEGNTIWEFTYSNNEHRLHHDIEVLPNGNILMIAWEIMTAEDAIAVGRNPSTIENGKLFFDHIIEVKPIDTSNAEIVWEWHVWDHLIQDYDPEKPQYGTIQNHPELININYDNGFKDFTHINSVDYNEELDQILLSVRNFNEIWVIDHSTTTEEAAGHSGGRYGKGGNLLYRWGNPKAYNAGTEEDRQLFSQHDATWIPNGYPGEGNILLFNNIHILVDEDNPNLRYYSSVDEIKPPIDNKGNYNKIGKTFGPAKPIWSYTANNIYDFYSGHLSSAQRLPNGNTLICQGFQGKFFEVTAEKHIVWQYTNPYGTPNHVNKIQRYAPTYPGIQDLLD